MLAHFRFVFGFAPAPTKYSVLLVSDLIFDREKLRANLGYPTSPSQDTGRIHKGPLSFQCTSFGYPFPSPELVLTPLERTFAFRNPPGTILGRK
ncbi:Hypothetical protein NTJ_06619 [Nesidiocoris tenuis]|uniref:Uncharacterized protein n=1 Tax=Nesidiocoris tenuis TaxID=355587 RepID=A0ABN7ASA1_9HEMI|nr:Hypothetical protein NTJ_06619 [Nesidiocoris tenuis]